MRTPDYYEVLAKVHEDLRPRTYLEIGVRRGESAALALAGTKVVGVDPAPRLNVQLPRGAIIEETTSDEFFASGRARQAFDGQPIDLAFVDGMHHFEFALRDFLNIERHALASSVVLVHDCLPGTADEAVRDAATGGDRWAGDVWKLLAYLIDERPDLHVQVIDTPPTGLGVIQNLDPEASTVDIEAVVDRYSSLVFDDLSERVLERVEVLQGGWRQLRLAFPDSAWQTGGRPRPLVRDRERRLRPGTTRYGRVRKRVGRTSAGQRLLLARQHRLHR